MVEEEAEDDDVGAELAAADEEADEADFGLFVADEFEHIGHCWRKGTVDSLSS